MRRPRFRIRLLLAVALVTMLALAGCSAEEPEFTAQDQIPAELRTEEPAAGDGGDGGDGGGEPSGEVYTFVGIDIDYTDAPSEVAAGTVTFELVNEGGTPHDVTLEEGGVIVEAQGGETATGDVTLEPGSYVYYCSVPGHRSAGMEGEFTVS